MVVQRKQQNMHTSLKTLGWWRIRRYFKHVGKIYRQLMRDKETITATMKYLFKDASVKMPTIMLLENYLIRLRPLLPQEQPPQNVHAILRGWLEGLSNNQQW